MTRDASYRKRPRSDFPRAVLRVKYGDYPEFVQTMMTRSEEYNREAELCHRLEKSGEALIIRPSRPILLSRYEKDPEKLREIYEMGVCDCFEKLPALRAFIKEPS